MDRRDESQAEREQAEGHDYEETNEREARLAAEIAHLLKKAQKEDAAEDEEFGEGKDASDKVAPETKR